MTIHIPQRGRECLATAETLFRAAKAMTDRTIAGQLKARADDYQRRAGKASYFDAAQVFALSAVTEEREAQSKAYYFFVTALQSVKVEAEFLKTKWNDFHHRMAESFSNSESCFYVSGTNMGGDVIRFVPKSERERARLIREARTIYNSVFPPADPVNEEQNKVPATHLISDANIYGSDGGLLP